MKTGRDVMPTLTAKCPRCKSEDDTGIAADQQTMRELGPSLSVLVLCERCREYQKMMVEDLCFAADAPGLAG